MFLSKQTQYAPDQILRPEHLIVGDQYQVCRLLNGEKEILYNGRLRLVYTSDRKIVLSMNDGSGDLQLSMYDLHIVPDENGQWDASSLHLVRVPLLK